MKHAKNYIDLSGQHFVRWHVVGFAGKDKRGEALWKCICECGQTRNVIGSHLRKGATQSCGCLAKELTSIRAAKQHTKGNTKHNGSKTRLYTTWENMKTRCFNKNNRNFKWYGEIGVTVCPEWLKFENFQKWAQESGYKEDLTIERKNPFGNYEPSNCTWIPKSEQRKNQRRSKEWVRKD